MIVGVWLANKMYRISMQHHPRKTNHCNSYSANVSVFCLNALNMMGFEVLMVQCYCLFHVWDQIHYRHFSYQFLLPSTNSDYLHRLESRRPQRQYFRHSLSPCFDLPGMPLNSLDYHHLNNLHCLGYGKIRSHHHHHQLSNHRQVHQHEIFCFLPHSSRD